jgi:hypothetical protein
MFRRLANLDRVTPSWKRRDHRNLRWWTRSQSIRTLAEIPLEVPIIDPVQTPKYQKIAAEAVVLRRLGLPVYKIARALGVAAKTVLRAFEWMDEVDR